MVEGQAGAGSGRRIWYVDLVLGAWRPREAALQLATELGLELGPVHADDPDRALMVTGPRAIDVEAAGDPVIATAYDDAERIGATLPGGATVVVFTPRYGLPLRIENEWFFLFLRRSGISVAAIGDEPTMTVGKTLFERRRGLAAPEVEAKPESLGPDQLRLLRYYPGPLPRVLVERLKIDAAVAGLIPVGSGHFLVPVNYRDHDPHGASREFDAMTELEALDDGFRGLSQSFCTGYFADPVALSDLAGRQLLSGSPDLARGLAERARLVARRLEDAALADVRRQEVRLFERRFSEMVAATEPSQRAPAALRDQLERLRAWGDVMSGNLTAAERRLAPLVSRLDGGIRLDGDDHHLIGALADARLDKRDATGAAALAESLSAAIAREPEPDQRLVFENAMTFARLHRVRGEDELHRADLQRAFATSLGARRLAEILEMNVLQAAAEKDPQSPAARHAWLRAALAWLGIEPMEGLSRRSARAVLGRDVIARARLDIDVSEALASALEAAWPDLAPASQASVPVFRGGGQSPSRIERLLGGPGAAILWSAEAGEDPVYARPRMQLGRVVLGALATLCPRIGELTQGTIVIDTNLGVDLPRSREEALSVALRSGAAQFAYGLDDILLDENLRPRFAESLRAGLSPIVHRIAGEADAPTITFRRHLRPTTLTGGEARTFAPFRQGTHTLPAIAEQTGVTLAEAESTLRQLEAKHVIRLDVSAH